MDYYNLNELAMPYDRNKEFVDEFRTASADILGTIDVNPYTKRMRESAPLSEMAQVAPPAAPQMGMPPIDPTMLPPEMMGQQVPPMQAPGQITQPGINPIEQGMGPTTTDTMPGMV